MKKNSLKIFLPLNMLLCSSAGNSTHQVFGRPGFQSCFPGFFSTIAKIAYHWPASFFCSTLNYNCFLPFISHTFPDVVKYRSVHK